MTPCRSFSPRHKPSRGFTLLETLIYIGLVASVMAALAFILLAVFQSRSIAAAQIRLQNTERIVEWTLRERLEESMEVTVPSSGTSAYLLIETPDTEESPVLFAVVSDALMMQLGDASAEALTPENVRVTSFSVERLDGTPAAVTITIAYETDALNATIQASSTVSVTLRYEEASAAEASGGEESGGESDTLSDLTVASVSVDGSGGLSMALANDGEGDADAEEVLISIAVDGDIAWIYSASSFSDQSFLEAGGSANVSVSTAIEEGASVEVCVDRDNLIEEEQEDNNCAETDGEAAGDGEEDEDGEGDDEEDDDDDGGEDDEEDDEEEEAPVVEEEALPDLTVSNIALDDRNRLVITLANEGNADADAANVRIFIYLNGTLKWTYNATTLSNKNFLTAGGSSTLSPQIMSEDTTVQVCIDPKNKVEEQDEENNCLEETLEI